MDDVVAGVNQTLLTHDVPLVETLAAANEVREALSEQSNTPQYARLRILAWQQNECREGFR